jgi:hypothetical protein
MFVEKIINGEEVPKKCFKDLNSKELIQVLKKTKEQKVKKIALKELKKIATFDDFARCIETGYSEDPFLWNESYSWLIKHKTKKRKNWLIPNYRKDKVFLQVGRFQLLLKPIPQKRTKLISNHAYFRFTKLYLADSNVEMAERWEKLIDVSLDNIISELDDPELLWKGVYCYIRSFLLRYLETIQSSEVREKAERLLKNLKEKEKIF